jgi:hypothetical protein
MEIPLSAMLTIVWFSFNETETWQNTEKYPLMSITLLLKK